MIAKHEFSGKCARDNLYSRGGTNLLGGLALKVLDMSGFIDSLDRNYIINGFSHQTSLRIPGAVGEPFGNRTIIECYFVA